jgi:hypothetical protein
MQRALTLRAADSRTAYTCAHVSHRAMQVIDLKRSIGPGFLELSGVG